jgi:predicted nucleic acid-binding Zn ribbon protein
MTREKRDRGDSRDKRIRPQPIGRVVSDFLDGKGLTLRVQQSSVIDDWAGIVGPQIAKVTVPLSVTPDGTLFVAVATNGWMTELSLMEPELIRALNTHASARRVKKIRFQLTR